MQDGGEVWMLDSGNYNTQEVGIDKGVTVMSMPGVQGSLVAAASFIGLLPVLLAFIMLQRFFVAGLTAGATKG
mgnify:CR=1 FL=1